MIKSFLPHELWWNPSQTSPLAELLKSKNEEKAQTLNYFSLPSYSRVCGPDTSSVVFLLRKQTRFYKNSLNSWPTAFAAESRFCDPRSAPAGPHLQSFHCLCDNSLLVQKSAYATSYPQVWARRYENDVALVTTAQPSQNPHMCLPGLFCDSAPPSNSSHVRSHQNWSL